MKRHSPQAGRGFSPWPLILLVMILALSACQAAPLPTGPSTLGATPAAEPVAGPTVLPYEPPEPSATVEATETLAPTEIPATATPEPPTATPEPTLTPTLGPTRVPKSVKETENFLVLGIDPRPGDVAWRTDTIMVVSVDYDANQVGIFSIPRDLWVNIPGYGMGRINQADYHGEANKYPGGGPALVSEIIADVLGVPTQHWVRIKQEGLVELVDALGGVDITLNCPLHELTPHPSKPGQFEKFDLPAGVNHLDGAAAKKFATFRYNSNDFYRGQRQQQLIWAIKERALQMDALTKLPQLWRALSHTFQTDLGLLDFVRLARVGAGLQANEIHGLTFSNQAIVYAEVGGAQVLKIGDRSQLDQELAGLFAQKSISQQGVIGSNATCPTPTTPTPVVTPLVTDAEAGTATPMLTPLATEASEAAATPTP